MASGPPSARPASFDGGQPTSMAEGVDRPCRAQVVTRRQKPWSSLRSKMDEAVLECGHIGPSAIRFDRREDPLRLGWRLLNFVSVGIAIALSVQADLSPSSNCRTFRLGCGPMWARAKVKSRRSS